MGDFTIIERKLKHCIMNTKNWKYFTVKEFSVMIFLGSMSNSKISECFVFLTFVFVWSNGPVQIGFSKKRLMHRNFKCKTQIFFKYVTLRKSFKMCYAFVKRLRGILLKCETPELMHVL